MKRLLAGGPEAVLKARILYDAEERQDLADALAAVTGTANLLGRSRIRLHQQRVEARHGAAAFGEKDASGHEHKGSGPGGGQFVGTGGAGGSEKKPEAAPLWSSPKKPESGPWVQESWKGDIKVAPTIREAWDNLPEAAQNLGSPKIVMLPEGGSSYGMGVIHLDPERMDGEKLRSFFYHEYAHYVSEKTGAIKSPEFQDAMAKSMRRAEGLTADDLQPVTDTTNQLVSYDEAHKFLKALKGEQWGPEKGYMARGDNHKEEVFATAFGAYVRYNPRLWKAFPEMHKFLDGMFPYSSSNREERQNLAAFSEPLFDIFEDSPLRPLSPEKAVEYFKGLIPMLGTNPHRFGVDQRRRAFTLAAATDEVVLDRVQGAIQGMLETGKDVGRGHVVVQDILDAAGVSTRSPQYSEMVVRTNLVDSYNVGADEERQDPDVADTFPVWRYVGILDGRQRPEHEIHFDSYYPNAVSFAAVRDSVKLSPWHCRCGQIPIDKWAWAKLQEQGASIAPGWGTVEAPSVPAPAQRIATTPRQPVVPVAPIATQVVPATTPVVQAPAALPAAPALPAQQPIPSAVPPVVASPADLATAFAADFNSAFQALDVGGNNFVSLVALRQVLSRYSRQQFDSMLQQLRAAGVLSLRGAEGRFGLTPEQIAASIIEGDREHPVTLLYVSRRG